MAHPQLRTFERRQWENVLDYCTSRTSLLSPSVEKIGAWRKRATFWAGSDQPVILWGFRALISRDGTLIGWTCSGVTAREPVSKNVVFVCHCHIRSITIVSVSRRYIPRRRHRKPCGSTGLQVNMVSPSPPFETVSYQNDIRWLQWKAFIPSFVSHSGEPVAATYIRILSWY